MKTRNKAKNFEKINKIVESNMTKVGTFLKSRDWKDVGSHGRSAYVSSNVYLVTALHISAHPKWTCNDKLIAACEFNQLVVISDSPHDATLSSMVFVF